MSRAVRLLSFNLGLLRKLGGLLQPTPFLEERLAAMPEALRQVDADVICLQEIYEPAHRRRLFASVADCYPNACEARPSDWQKLDSGLAALSKYLIHSEMKPFTRGPIEERLFAEKGALVVRVAPEGARPLVLFNTHTTAGGVFSHPEAPAIDRHRARQIAELLALTDGGGEAIPLIIGDLNAGPGVSETNFRLFEDAGWVDLYQLLHGDADRVTWDPQNRLNRHGPHRTSPPQRIDHLLVRRRDLESGAVVPKRVEIVLGEECVDVGGAAVSLSDHCALLAELEIATNGV